MKKAFIFSMDASIAVMIAILMITAILFYFSQNSHSGNRENLNNIGLDGLTILEKEGALSSSALTLDSGALDSYLNLLPYNVCAELDISEAGAGGSLTKILSHFRLGCPFPKDYIIQRRVFIAAGNTYLAEMEVWQK